MTEVTPTIEVRGICKYFGAVTALEDVSLKVMPGEVQTIVLPSTQAGPYFILVHGREGSVNGKPFSLKIEQLPLQVTDVTPNRGANVGTTTLLYVGRTV